MNFLKELDGRVRVAIAGTGIQNLGQSLSGQYNQLYAKDLGAGYVEIGSLNSVGAAVTSIISVPLGWAAEKYSVKRVLLLGLACAMASAAIYALAGSWWVLVPAIILSRIAMRIINPLTDVIFVTHTKPEQSGTVMGLSRVVWGVLSTFAPMIAAIIVANSGGINARGIRPLYSIQLLLAMFVFLFMASRLQTLPTRVDRRKDEPGKEGAGLVQDFRELFRGERWLKRWVALRMIRQFGVSVAMPFVPLWMVNVKGADPYILGVMGTVSAIISSLLQIPAGRLADKIGRKRVFFLLRPVTYLGTLLMILAPRPEYLIVVGLLGAVGMRGGAGGVSFTPFITMHWEMVPGEKRGRWFGIEGLMSIMSIPATLLGGILWQYGFMTETLLLPIILEALFVIPILITVPDTLGRN
ncbi:MAG: MFS transporter [Candidatus Bathyarchaeota archaeon]|nr:MFS transporter [Candidatus Bathyarchaeota archaeon]